MPKSSDRSPTAMMASGSGSGIRSSSPDATSLAQPCLSLVAGGIGLAIMVASYPLREGWAFDLISMIGGGLFTAGAFGLMAGPLRERNRPEEPPQ
jgi:hypothetical protein